MQRSRVVSLIVCGGILLAGGAALADDTPSSQQTPPASATPPSTTGTAQGATTDATTPPDPMDEVICKREDMTGTRVSRQKICMTRRDWEEQAKESGEDIRSAHRSSGLHSE